MKLKHVSSSLFLVLTSLVQCFGQSKYLGFQVSYGGQLPYGKLADTYGSFLDFGVGADMVFASNYVVTIEGVFGFGNSIKVDPLAKLRQPNFTVIGGGGSAADFFLTLKSNQVVMSVRKILGKSSTGFHIGGGVGLGTYGIRINDQSSSLIAATKPYSALYDQLERGAIFKQQIGYDFHSKSGRFNGSLTLINTIGFMKYVRDIDRNNQDGTNINNTLGIRGTFDIPIKKFSVSDKVKYY